MSLAPETLGYALVGAFAGGICLNAMPCVFPVLGLKLASLTYQLDDESVTAKQVSDRLRVAGLLYAAGTLFAILLLAAVLLAVRSLGGQVGWGFQLQDPSFIAFMAIVFFLVALNLLGLFDVDFPSRFIPSGLARARGLIGEFASGVLSVLVATPCSAPLMAPAIGFALSQSVFITLLVFASLGAGIALPFTALCFFPRAASRLPRPGRWMMTFKQGLAFPVMGAVIWLFWVLSRQSDGFVVVILASTLLLLAFGLWVRSHLGPLSSEKPWLWRFRIVMAWAVIGSATGSSIWTLALARSMPNEVTKAAPREGAEKQEWIPYSNAVVEKLRLEKRIVFVDFTADWCLSCKVNEKVVFSSERVWETLRSKNAALVRADWTTDDPAITAALASFGRASVPLYLMYPEGEGDPEILPQVLTPSLFLEALDRADTPH